MSSLAFALRGATAPLRAWSAFRGPLTGLRSAACAVSAARGVRPMSSAGAVSPAAGAAKAVAQELVFPPPPSTRGGGWVPHIRSEGEYAFQHAKSLRDPAAYWARVAAGFVWKRKWDTVLGGSLAGCDTTWFAGATLNITESALDRHIAAGHGDKPALTWEGDDGVSETFTFSDVLERVCTLARVLQANGVRKGDIVSIYLPMIPQAAFAMLACARIGAVHSVVFAGFSADSIADRIVNGKSDVLITADAGLRGGKIVPLKAVVDCAVVLAAEKGQVVRCVLVTHRAGEGAHAGAPGWVEGRDVSLDEGMAALLAPARAGGRRVSLPAVEVDAQDPLFVLYTSGSTGKPKGVVHAVGGWMCWVGDSFRTVFDARPSAATYAPGSSVKPDVHFSTADVGWVTGHSYNVYGPLLNGTHTLLFEGTPMHPTPARLWHVIEKHGATTLYTAPTAIRALMTHGSAPVEAHDLSSLRLMGSVGEPIGLEAWSWYNTVVGKGRLPIIDTYWQTETGGIVLSSFPGGTAAKPGKATKPYFGIDARVVREMDGVECEVGEGGILVIDSPWPGMARTVLGDHARYRETYFSQLPGRYFTGDGAIRDRDGDIQISGRVDDVINVSGHRLGSAEVESAITHCKAVSEAAVVGFPHDIKGEGLFCYVTLKALPPGSPPADVKAVTKDVIAAVRSVIGAIATPDVVYVVRELPKTRSGKIMRRILKKVAAGQTEGFGDLSTLADEGVVREIVAGRPHPAHAVQA